MYRFVWLSMFCVLGLSGCGGGADGTVNVSGTITLDGQPLSGANVNFISPDGKFAGYGKTNANGVFTLVQGAKPGENRIVISKVDPAQLPAGGAFQFSENPEDGMDHGQLGAMMFDTTGTVRAGTANITGETLPAEYSDPASTQLTFNVPDSGTSSADFRLSSP